MHSARELGLSLDCNIFCMPAVANYLGGDITSGLLLTDLDARDDPAVFLDVGTNGELALGCREYLLAGAGAAGPALEGAVSKSGMRAEPGEDYITILSESLQKKNKILDAIRAANEEQKVLLADEMLGPDDFERTLDKKAALVEELNCLDDGFQQIYEQVRPEIEQNMGKYAEQIRLMQELIREIVAKTMSAQAEEARNKQLIEKKFASVKKQIREVKSSQKAVNTYYQNMMKNAYLDSQFLDRKK